MEQGNGLRSLDASGSVGATGPEPLLEYAKAINELLIRVASLEQDRERFLKALRGAVGMLLENPMASAMMPKDMKHDLRQYLEQHPDGTTPQV